MSEPVDPVFWDVFGDDVARGKVIGSRGTGGVERSGIDAHGALAVDNHALRINSLRHAGWGVDRTELRACRLS